MTLTAGDAAPAPLRPANAGPRLSLILCTRNRGGALKRALNAIGGLQCDVAWEILLVDNGSTDDTRDVIEAFAASAPAPVHYVWQPIKGLSNARNAGLERSSGEIIVFTDDDCYVQHDFLTAIDRVFSTEPKLGYVSGRILLFDPTDYPTTINESREPLRFPPGQYLAPGAIKGANLAFRRAALDQVGGFDPLFGSGALFPSEDIDTAARVSRQGWWGCYDPDVVVAHHHGRKAADVPALQKAYDIGRGAYHAKLMLHDRAIGAAAKGWLGLPRRMRHRPASLLWELAGALHYARARGRP